MLQKKYTSIDIKSELLEESNNEFKQTLTAEGMKTFILSAIGGSLEFYDFVVYIFFANIISKVFFDTTSTVTGLLLALNVYASGYFARIFGGFILSHFGDKKGRKNSFSLTILLMAIPTFIIGVLPSYHQIGYLATLLLILCRVTQGLAVGGELPCSITFVFEHASNHKKAFYCGILFCGVILGMFWGSIIAAIITKSLSHESLLAWGWRIPFLLGGVFGSIGLYLRRKLSETPVFKQMQKDNAKTKVPIKTILSKYKMNALQTTFSCFVTAVVVALVYLYFPTYFQTFYNFTPNIMFILNGMGVLMYSFLIILFGKICDKYGERIILLSSCLGFIVVSIPLFMSFKSGQIFPIVVSYFIMSILAAGISASSIVQLAKAFPANVRYSGSALSYNLAFGLFGGFTPLIVTALISKTDLKYSPAFYLVLVAALGFIFNIKKIKAV